MIESLYHNCRNCHWFEKGKCLHGGTFDSGFDTIELVRSLSEEGLISGAIEESFSDGNFSDVKAALSETRLSKKKVDEIMKILYEEVKANQEEWVQAIDDAIFQAIEGTAFDKCGDPEPERPDDFFCKYFE